VITVVRARCVRELFTYGGSGTGACEGFVRRSLTSACLKLR
jgi:hypothetical protein